MKKILSLTLCILLTLVFPALSEAVTTTPTKNPEPTPKVTSEAFSKQISNLKDKIASRVAELKLVEKKGTIGTVDQVKDLEISITDLQGKPRFIDVDEITKFVAENNKTFGISDLKKGSTISVIGRYNKDSQRLLARFVETVTPPTFLNGSISAIDENGFSFTVKTQDNTSVNVDVEKITKTQSYTKGGSLEKSGFSKMSAGDTVFVTGFKDKNDPKKILATRILFIPSQSEDTSPSESPTPTKTSVKKIAPTASQ